MMPFKKADCRDCDFETEDREEAKKHAKDHNGNHSVVLTKVAPTQ